MKDVLFIKTSSLGDVIHHMPALTEARARRPDARFSLGGGGGVRAAGAAASGGRRGHPGRGAALAAGAAAAFDLARDRGFPPFARAQAFDEIIDSQGLFFKSALIARYAQGRRHGYDRNSIKEPAASWLYDVKPSGRVETARDCAKPRADRPRLWAMCRKARRTSGSTARASRRAGDQALWRVAARHRAGRQRNGRRRTGGCSRRRSAAVTRSGHSVRQRAERERAAASPGHAARAGAGAAAARSGGAADGRRVVRGWRRHRASASRRSARRAAGCDFSRQRAGADRADGAGADGGARRERRAAVGAEVAGRA